MMASPSELSLDCKAHSYSMLRSMNGDQQTDQTQKLQEFLSRLEEERLKIDAFKRELPLCMQLLSNAMETSREQLQNSRTNQGARPILEEFIPLKNSSLEGPDKASLLTMSDNKATWMTSAQLWNDPNGTNPSLVSSVITSSKETDHNISLISVSPKLGLDSKERNASGAFIPFSKELNLCPNPNLHTLPDLALASLGKDIEEKKFLESESSGLTYQTRENSVKNSEVSDNQTNSIITGATPANSQTHRKARRCWSPDLHRRFVSALQMLGGSQVATPKQIRELMKVDGLTNDEVKSHLQKYRLHTRRPGPSPQAAGNPTTTQLVVLGGIWVPPEYAAHHGGGATAALYGAAHPTNHPNPHYCTQQLPHEFYQTAPLQQQQLHHHQLQMYKPLSQNQRSPDSGRTGDRSESIEDGKSESGGSWKADSGGCENGGERKGMVLREDGEESNGRNITLKF